MIPESSYISICFCAVAGAAGITQEHRPRRNNDTQERFPADL
jgi:hypothetical protein